MSTETPDKWITAVGWNTVHIQRGESHPVDSPHMRWALCGRLVRSVLPAMWEDEHRCGQCLRRLSGLGRMFGKDHT
jgi:hypothetical protein